MVGICAAQQRSAPDTAAAADTTAEKKAVKIQLEVGIIPADTIPEELFEIVDELGLHKYTHRLLSRLDTLPDDIILESLVRADMQTDHLRANAFAVMEAIRLISQRDSLWKAFFFDLNIQLKEPNIIRVNFKDRQKWKSYALNELFYSNAFQELLHTKCLTAYHTFIEMSGRPVAQAEHTLIATVDGCIVLTT